jgi:hypothetical protein
MQTYHDLVELARICADNARATRSRGTAEELWTLAREYQAKAAVFGSKGPDIGKPSFGVE